MTMKRDVLTFGETMLRFSPPRGLRLGQVAAFEVWVGGSESNTAATLSALGASVTWVSRLPDQPLGRRVEAELRARGIAVSDIVWTAPDDRLGIFYAEEAGEPRTGTVVYDRARSAASQLTPADLPDALFAAHRHLHVSGITPALSETCAHTVADAIARARAQGLSVSLDVNYRARLWSAEAAAAGLAPLLERADLVFCSHGDAIRLFGLSGDDTQIARDLRAKFDIPLLAITCGERGAVAVDTYGGHFAAPCVPVAQTIGRFGSGDSFAGAFLAEYLAGRTTEEALRFGVAAAAVKRTIPGDMLLATRSEVEAVATQEERTWR